MKKFISLILAIAMCLSMGVTAFAVEYANVDEFLAACTEETAIPYSGTVAPENCDSYVNEYGHTKYGVAYKIVLDQTENIRIAAGNDNDDAVIEVYRMDAEGAVFESGTDVHASGKETMRTQLDAGTYYIIVSEYSGLPQYEVEVSITFVEDYVDYNEFLDAVEETTVPPVDEVLVPENFGIYGIYDDYEDILYEYHAYAYKLELFDGDALKASIESVGGYNYAYVELVHHTENGNSYIAYDYVNDDGKADIAADIDTDGTYYIVVASDDGKFNHSINVNIELIEAVAPEDAGTYDDIIDGAEEVTLPVDETAEHEDFTPYADEGNVYYAKAYKFAVNEGETIVAGAEDIRYGTDLVINLYKETEIGYEYVDGLYVDYEYLEKFTYTAQAGNYVLVVEKYNSGVIIGKIDINIDAYTISETLDFVEEPVPTPGETDLWSWDEETKTLTLKDGFSITTKGDCIKLPDGSTLIVEGEATLVSIGGDGIECAEWLEDEEGNEYDIGDLTIDGKETGKLNITAGEDGIYAEGDAAIKDCEIYIIEAEDEGIDIRRGLSVTGSKITVYSDQDGIEVTNNINITESEIYVKNGDDEGIDSEEDIFITDSDITLISDDDAIAASNNVTITGSELYVEADGNDGIDAEGIVTLTETAFEANIGSDGIEAHKTYLTDSEFTVNAENCGIIAEGHYSETEGGAVGRAFAGFGDEDEADDDDEDMGISTFALANEGGSEEGTPTFIPGEIVIENCETNIECDYFGLSADGKVAVTEGTLNIKSKYIGIEAGELEMTDVWFDIESIGDNEGIYEALAIGSEFTLPGYFAAENGETELHEGEWLDEILYCVEGEESYYTVAIEAENLETDEIDVVYAAHVYSCEEEDDEEIVIPIPDWKPSEDEAVIIDGRDNNEQNPNTGAAVSFVIPAILAAAMFIRKKH